MKWSVLWGLAGLNAILLCLFIGQFHAHVASAQLRRPPDYLMIPGEVSGAPNEIVYIIDTTNSRLGAFSYDDGTHTLQNMPTINLNTVFNAVPVR